MQQQPNGVDCGIFPAAFAVDILNEFAEIRKHFDVGKMRLHLLKCFKEEEFTLFPRSHKHTKLSKGHIIYVDIYCICRSPFYEEDSKRDENLFMAECVKCGEWYQKRCLEIPSRVFTNESQVEMFEMLENNIKIEKEKKKILYFSSEN